MFIIDASVYEKKAIKRKKFKITQSDLVQSFLVVLFFFYSSQLMIHLVLVCTVQQIANGSYVPNQPTLNTDESVTYSCDTGFELSGQAQITCLIDGNFSPGIPLCIRGEANLFTTITNKVKVLFFIAELLLANDHTCRIVVLSPLGKAFCCTKIIITF